MFEYQSVYNGYTALIAGLVTSIHCVAMCGPLSCAFTPMRAEEGNPQVVLTVYHLAKLIAYGLVGALAGAIGGSVIDAVEGSWLNYLPWILVVFFLLVAFRLDRLLPKPKATGRAYRALTRRFMRLRKEFAAGIIGFASPLLPCGPLYVIFGLCLFSGSALQGLEFAVGFGLGTLPLLWLAQAQFMRMRHRVSSKWMVRLQRSVALIAALVVAWRLRGTMGFETSGGFFCY